MQGGIFTGLAIGIGILVLIFLGLAALFGTTFAAGFFFVLVSFVLVLAILIQKPKGGGLAAAFGGGGGGDQAMFGARVGDVMTWVTVVLFATFLGLAITLVYTTEADEAAIIQPAISSPDDAPADDGSSSTGGVDLTLPAPEVTEPTGDTPTAPTDVDGATGDATGDADTSDTPADAPTTE